MYLDGHSKENKDILYEFVQQQSLFSSKKLNLDYFLPSFKGKIYDRHEMLVKLESLVDGGFLLDIRHTVKIGEIGTFVKGERYDTIYEFGIKDTATYRMLYSEFYYRILFDNFLEFLSNIIKVVVDNLKQIGVAVATSIITTYLCLRFFGVVR